MTTEDTKTAILSIITDVAPEVDPATVPDDADLRDTLDIDSMDLLKIFVSIAERFGVEIDEGDYGEVDTLARLVAYVTTRSRGA